MTAFMQRSASSKSAIVILSALSTLRSIAGIRSQISRTSSIYDKAVGTDICAGMVKDFYSIDIPYE